MQGGQNTILQQLYDYDSDEDSPKHTTDALDSALGHFRPYRKVVHLCFKDRNFAFVGTANKPASGTSGFLPCLATLQDEGIVIEPNSDNYVSEDITDSELLNCLHEMENMVSTTPDKRLRLVNSILEDFALSPLREKNEEETTKFWEYSPQFILKSKPRITYSSRRHANQRPDCNKRLEFNKRLELNDECIGDSDSSSISVQENRTQSGEISASTVVAGTTEMLCENLLNLSAYFTQKSPTTINYNPADALPAYEYPAEGEENDLWDTTSNVVQLVQDINSFSVTNYQVQWINNSSSEELIGFPESNSNEGSKNETRLQADECKISDVTFLCELSSQTPNKDHKNDYFVDNDHDKPKDLLDEWNKDYSEIFALVKTPPQCCKSRLRKSIDTVHESKAIMNLGFTTALSQPTLMTEGAKSKADKIFRNLSGLYPKKICKRNILNETNTQIIATQSAKRSSLNDLDNLPSTSKAAIRANKEFIKRKSFDGKSDEEPFDDKIACTPSKQMRYTAKSRSNITETALTPFSPNKTKIGFQTASGRQIKPTNKALKSIAELLKEFQSEAQQFDETGLEALKNNINLKQSKQPASNTNDMKEKEPVTEDEFNNVVLSEWPLEEELQNVSQNMPSDVKVDMYKDNIALNPASPKSIAAMSSSFKGFCTAGGKNVLISEKAQKTAASLLKTLKEDCDTNELLDVKNKILKKNRKSSATENQFNGNINTTLALKDSSFYQKDEGSGVKLNDVHLHPIRINEGNSTSSLTMLSVKSPLNESVTKSIIARKNILSLSKRRQKTGRISPAICDNVNANTPVKMQSCFKSTSEMATLSSTPSSSFNASNCSTPCSQQRVSCLREMDDDLKPIPWHDNKSISNAYSNTTFSSPRPSVEDRLGRLKMYGDPPPISPILTNFQNKCRSSGLRPTRSMLKKHESN